MDQNPKTLRVARKRVKAIWYVIRRPYKHSLGDYSQFYFISIKSHSSKTTTAVNGLSVAEQWVRTAGQSKLGKS